MLCHDHAFAAVVIRLKSVIPQSDCTNMSSGRIEEQKLEATLAVLAQNRSPVDGVLVNKATLAALLTCLIRKVDKLIKQKRMPVIRLGARCHRFDVADVLAALNGGNS